MHGILLGVCKELLKLWLDSKCSGEDWYCGSLIGLIDERLLSIKLPNSITRVPRSLEHHRKYWKGICLTVFFSIIMRYACGTVLLIKDVCTRNFHNTDFFHTLATVR